MAKSTLKQGEEEEEALRNEFQALQIQKREVDTRLWEIEQQLCYVPYDPEMENCQGCCTGEYSTGKTVEDMKKDIKVMKPSKYFLEEKESVLTPSADTTTDLPIKLEN